jgi:hypothetical protein
MFQSITARNSRRRAGPARLNEKQRGAGKLYINTFSVPPAGKICAHYCPRCLLAVSCVSCCSVFTVEARCPRCGETETCSPPPPTRHSEGYTYRLVSTYYRCCFNTCMYVEYITTALHTSSIRLYHHIISRKSPFRSEPLHMWGMQHSV